MNSCTREYFPQIITKRIGIVIAVLILATSIYLGIVFPGFLKIKVLTIPVGIIFLILSYSLNDSRSICFCIEGDNIKIIKSGLLGFQKNNSERNYQITSNDIFCLERRARRSRDSYAIVFQTYEYGNIRITEFSRDLEGMINDFDKIKSLLANKCGFKIN